MEQPKTFTSSEVMSIYRDGQKQGFIAGIIVCLAVKYARDRHTITEKQRRYPFSRR